MPKYRVELHDGRTFDVEADSQPTEDEVLAAIPASATREDNRSTFAKLWDKASTELLPDFNPQQALEGGIEGAVRAVSPWAADRLHQNREQIKAENPTLTRLNESLNPANVAYEAVRVNSSPVNAGLLAATGGASLLPRAARVVEGLGGLGMAARGVEQAADTDAPISERVMGGVNAVLGGFGVRGAMRGAHVPGAAEAGVADDVTELAGGHSPFAQTTEHAPRPTVDPLPSPVGAPAPPMSWAERARYAETEGMDIPTDRIATEMPQEAVIAQQQAEAAAQEAAFAARAREVQQARQPKARDLMDEYGARSPEEATDLFTDTSHSGMGAFRQEPIPPDSPAAFNRSTGERGAVDPILLARMGGGTAGAAYGFATGDDTQSRLERAAIFGTAGALAPSMLGRPASSEAMLDNLASGKNLSRVEGLADVMERGGKPSTASVAKGIAPSVADDTSRAGSFIERHVTLNSPADEALAKQILSDGENFYKQRRMSQSWQQTEAAADDLAVDDLKKMLPRGTTLNAEQTEAYRRAAMGAVGEAQEAIAAIKAAGDQATDAMRADSAEKMMKAVAGLSSLFGTRSEAGRALNIYKKFAVAKRQGDVGFVRKLLESGYGKEEVAQHLANLSGDPVKQMQFLRSMAQPKFGDYWRWYMLSNILSGPVTHLRNIGGNAVEGATMFGGRAIGEVLSTVRGGQQRLVAPGETLASAEGAVKGLNQAWTNALHFFQNGFSRRDAEAFKDIPAEVFGGNTAANVVGRGLGAMDQFFQTLNFSSELYALARRKAFNEGLRGSRLSQRADELVAAPTDDLVGAAGKFAEKAVFRDKGGKLTSLVSQGVRAVDDSTANVGKALAAKIAPTVGNKPARFFGEIVSLPFGTAVMPFVNTPASIIRHGVKTMGGGFVTGASKLRNAETAREGLQDIGEAGVGAMVMGGAALLAAQGRLTGAAPSDPREREKWYADGRRPNSVKIGDKWVSFNSLGRMTLPLSTIANAYDIYNQTGKVDPGLILATTAKAQLDSSYLSGIAAIFNAVHEGGRKGADGETNFDAYNRVLGNIAGSFLVPASGLMRGVRRAVDPVVRAPEGIIENVKNTIPGLSTDVTPRIDSAGNIPQFPAGLTGTGAERMLSPFDVSQDSPDPVRGAMAEVGEYLPTPSQKLKGLSLSDEQGVKLGQVMGKFQMEAVRQLVGSHRFYAMTPEQRQAAIKRVVSDARGQVSALARAAWQANTERP